MAETKPTPNPATRRPTTMVARAEAANILQEEKDEEEEDGGIVSSSSTLAALASQDICDQARGYCRASLQKTRRLELRRKGDALDNDAGNVDAATRDDGRATSHHVGEVSCDERAEEGARREDRRDERRARGGELRRAGAHDRLDELLGRGDTVDVARVVAEEDAAERGERAPVARGGERVSFVVSSRGSAAASSPPLERKPAAHIR